MPTEPDVNSGPQRRCQVAIIGAGPIGLMFANLLGAAGLEVVILERNPELLGLPRAIAYDAETLRLFAQIGLFDAIAPGLIQDPRVVYFNARGRTLMEMNVPRSPYGHSPLGTFYQPNFERALLDGLTRFQNVRVAFAHHVADLEQDAAGVALRIMTPDGKVRLSAEYVVACDGGASATRDKIGARAVGSTYLERWLVVDARIENHGVDTITFRCDPRRPTVQLPAVGSRVRWEFMQLPGENTEDLLREETVRSLLAPYHDLDKVEIERKTVYAFHARVVDRWRNGRVFLAGDAAHMMPPFAGQGMNGGMKDAANLSWKLAAVLGGQASAEILDTYEVERARNVRAMVNLSRRLGAVIMPTRPAVAGLRDAAFACLNLSAGFRAFIRRGGVLPPPRISRSSLTARGKDGLIGQMAPQPEVAGPASGAPLDHWLGCHQWLALGVGLDPVAELSKRDRSILETLGARFICLNASTSDPMTSGLRCEDSGFLAWAKRNRVHGLLVRPDRFIAQRLDRRANLRSLDMFAPAPSKAGARSREPALAVADGAAP
ncbi:MAG TPA: bifunctional 3-(3-hydroxy-phenyl)propionate/3-hydroxycinnamic acid hydroxylase [Roseiarcus sp.]